MDSKQTRVLLSSIVELQELIHEQALLVQTTSNPEERVRIQTTLNQLWALNRSRANRVSDKQS